VSALLICDWLSSRGAQSFSIGTHAPPDLVAGRRGARAGAGVSGYEPRQGVPASIIFQFLFVRCLIVAGAP
jgi:hypothetical protein